MSDVTLRLKVVREVEAPWFVGCLCEWLEKIEAWDGFRKKQDMSWLPTLRLDSPQTITRLMCFPG
jgi:hypothetical protein